MQGRLAGLGKGSSIAVGQCRLTLTSDESTDEEFIRALYSQWFEGFCPETDKVMIKVWGDVFERAGWTKPAVEEAKS